MRQKLLLMAIFVFALTNASLAGDDDADLKKGIRAGWQTSNFYGDSYDNNTKNYNSFYLGIFGEKKLIPLLRFGVGIEFSQTGSVSSAFDDTKYVRSQIYVPLYLKVKLGPIYGKGGLSPTFGLGNKYTLLGETPTLDDKAKTSVFDAPVFLGVGVKVLMFSFEARYNWGTSNLSKQDNDSFKQQFFQLGAAISF
jgi:hypothetical protein